MTASSERAMGKASELRHNRNAGVVRHREQLNLDTEVSVSRRPSASKTLKSGIGSDLSMQSAAPADKPPESSAVVPNLTFGLHGASGDTADNTKVTRCKNMEARSTVWGSAPLDAHQRRT